MLHLQHLSRLAIPLLLLTKQSTQATKTLPWSSNSSFDCINECIDPGYVYCPKGNYGFCCSPERCGDTYNCSGQNISIGARYLACVTDSFCGERQHTVSLDKVSFEMDSPDFSPASACIYAFEFPATARLGDILTVEVEGMRRTDLFYAQGINIFTAKGREVKEPLAGLFKVRYPDSLFLTLLNRDIERTELELPITVNYWLEPVDPSLKAEEYSNEPIPPEFALKLSKALPSTQKFEEEEADPMQTYLWIGFAIAVVLVGSIALMYYIMRQRRKKMQLQQALAEGKITMKNLEEQEEQGTDGNGSPSPDRPSIEMSNRFRHNDSHRGMMQSGRQSSDIVERFGSAHMNETAMEYFQNANLAGKTPEQMIKEFQAIQRFKEEELIQQQLNQVAPNALEDMLAEAANEESDEDDDSLPGGLVTDGNRSRPYTPTPARQSDQVEGSAPDKSL